VSSGRARLFGRGAGAIQDEGGDLAGAELVEGDARDEQALSRALEGCSGVIGSLGTPMSLFRESRFCSCNAGARQRDERPRRP
jgi:hypothetical protein